MKRYIFALIANFVAIASVQTFAMRRRALREIGTPLVRTTRHRLFGTTIRKTKLYRRPKTYTKIQKRHYTKPTEETPIKYFLRKNTEQGKSTFKKQSKPKRKYWFSWKNQPKKGYKPPKGYGGTPNPSLWQRIKGNKWVRRVTGFFGIGAGAYGYIKIAIPGNIQDLIQTDNINQFLTNFATRNAVIDIANENEDNRIEVGKLLLKNYQKILNSPVYAKNAAEVFQKFLKDVVPSMTPQNRFEFMAELLLTINAKDNFKSLNNNNFATEITLAMESQLGATQKEALYKIVNKNLESSLNKDTKVPILLGVLQYNDPQVDKQFKGIVNHVSQEPKFMQNPEIVFGFCNLHKEIRKKRKDLKYYTNKGQLLDAIEEMNKKGMTNLSAMETETFLSWSKPKQNALIQYIKLNFTDEGLTGKQYLLDSISARNSQVAANFANNPKMLQLITDNIKINDLIALKAHFNARLTGLDIKQRLRQKIETVVFPIIDKKLEKMEQTLKEAKKMQKIVVG